MSDYRAANSVKKRRACDPEDIRRADNPIDVEDKIKTAMNLGVTEKKLHLKFVVPSFFLDF